MSPRVTATQPVGRREIRPREVQEDGAAATGGTAGQIVVEDDDEVVEAGPRAKGAHGRAG